MSVTWEGFDYINAGKKEDEFQNLSHYLFLHLHNIPPWKVKEYKNQPGVEIEPIEVEVDGKKVFASYQAKHFDGEISSQRWKQCKKSVEVAVEKKRNGDYVELERIDFYINEDASQTNQARDRIEKIASEAGISIHWHYGKEILLELNNPSADETLKAIATRFFTQSELGRRIRLPVVDTPSTKTVGRSELATKIKQALRDYQRVQLFGLPGVGKSTLARHVAASEKTVLGAAIVSARDLLGVQGGESIEQQIQLLAEKAVSKFVGGRVEGDVLELAKDLFRSDERLLVIDNLEAPELIRRFIEEVRPARLLLTSRRDATYDLAEGVSFRVDELSPDAAREQFYNDSGLHEDHEREAVDEICSLLGRLPLAINLLAVQLESYFNGSPKEALNVLQQKRLEYLERYEDFSSSAENNLRLCFELSYEHLRPEQKYIFQIMGALMPSGSNLASIVYMSGLEEFSVKRALVELERRSLVDFSEGRYFLHTLLWEYARQKLEEGGDEGEIKTRVSELIDELLGGYTTRTQRVDLRLYERYWEQAAYLSSTVETELSLERFFKLVEATACYLMQTSQNWKALDYMYWALANARTSKVHSLEAQSLDMVGSIYQNLGLYWNAATAHEEALELVNRNNLHELKGTILHNLANCFQYAGDFDKALMLHKHTAAIAREIGDRRMEGGAIGGQAVALRALGNLEEAYELFAISLFIAMEVGHRLAEMFAFHLFSVSIVDHFGYLASRKYVESALSIAKELENRSMEALLFRDLGIIEQKVGNYEKALEHFFKSFEVACWSDDIREGMRTLDYMVEAVVDVGNLYITEEEYQKAFDSYWLVLNVSLENRHLRGVSSTLSGLTRLSIECNQYRHAIAFLVAACPILEAENKSAFDQTVRMLINEREATAKFDEFIEELIEGTDIPIIEDMRALGLLKGISREYLARILSVR